MGCWGGGVWNGWSGWMWKLESCVKRGSWERCQVEPCGKKVSQKVLIFLSSAEKLVTGH